MAMKSNPTNDGGRPQDAGHSWVILFGCFVLTYFVAAGTSVLGVLQVDLINMYPQDKVIVTWTAGTYLSLGFILSVPIIWLLSKYGRRKLAICAAIISSSSYIGAAFSTNPVVYFLLAGVMTGVCSSFHFLLAMMSSQKYFSQRRTMAQGILMSALSLGFLTYPILVRVIADYYAWRGAIFIHAAINLHVIPASLLLKEPRKGINPFWFKEKRHIKDTNSSKITTHIDKIEQSKLPERSANTEEEISAKLKGSIILSDKDISSEKEAENVKGWRDRYGPLAVIIDYPSLPVGAFSIFLVQCGNILPFIITPLMAEHIGAPKIQGALLLSIAAAISLIFRPTCGYIADRGFIDKIFVCGCACVIAGCLTTSIAFTQSYAALAGIIACIAFPSATFMVTWASILTELVPSKFSHYAISYGSMGFGLAELLSVGTTGLLLDLTGSPRMTFLISGCTEVLGGVLFLGVYLVTRKRCIQLKIQETGKQ